jgi:hypothetical protein
LEANSIAARGLVPEEGEETNPLESVRES